MQEDRAWGVQWAAEPLVQGTHSAGASEDSVSRLSNTYPGKSTEDLVTLF